MLLHAASFVHRGHGVLVTGWQKGGKTETLLPFTPPPARLVADEWTDPRPHRLCGMYGSVGGRAAAGPGVLRPVPQDQERITTVADATPRGGAATVSSPGTPAAATT